jgi:hypothetical protein
MKPLFLFILLGLWIGLTGFKSAGTDQVSFKTSKEDIVKVKKGIIYFNDKKILSLQYDDLIYGSKLNRLLENHNSIFLFLAEDGRPNLNHLQAYKITASKAVLVADAILSPLRDLDHDGFLEFGGNDLTEAYPNRDSMYYIPTAYYEIKNGKITKDMTLTRQQDIKLNGTYLKSPLDVNGNCCKVIPNPKRLKGKRKI